MENPTIKTFKLRGTRITAAQSAARQRLWSTYGIDYDNSPLDFNLIFPLFSKVIMEIGFGMGETTVNIAQRFPDTGFIAVDVHQPGIGKLLSLIEETGLNNVRVMDEDALKILRAMVPNNGLDAIHLFFPDPWPKTRHHKRRIVNSEFLKIIAEKLKVGGSVHLATDWEPYARWMEQEFSKSSSFKGGVVERPEWRPITRFEAQGLRKDHKVTDLMYEKI